MSEPQSAVVAGSKGFVDAMGAHLKMRFGAAPHVVRDAGEVLAACGDKGGLLVLEYAGSSWLEAVKGLRGLPGGGGVLSIVAAIAPAQSADAEPLRRAGVDEVVSWQGRVDPVVWAVDRVMGRSRGRQDSDPRPNPAPVRGDASETVSEPGKSPAAPAFRDPVPTPSGAPLSAANQAASEIAAVLWPGAVPSAASAEALLLSVVAGRAAGEAGQVAAAERVLAAVSALERTAFAGAEVPIDCAFLRSVVALRLRLDLALSSAPAAGCAVDQTVAEQLLADVDGILAQLKALAPSAPPGVMPALDPTRHAIVDGGVRVAGALSRLVQVGEAQPAALAANKGPTTRVLSNANAGETEGLGFLRKGPWIALALIFAAVAGYHGWRLATTPAPRPPATLAGAPANTYSVKQGATRLLKTLAGKTVDPVSLERFKDQEQLKGNVVRDLDSGTWAIEPDPTGGGSKP
ncbi:MAG: hypothetical protein A2V77_22615 [Anaeromyxobacter sp. RBG_16_69_14]|nr:MAG: hypothetical protein A2V77_22615 [Anaeromyxobacter sp. RBG_16_69_14]